MSVGCAVRGPSSFAAHARYRNSADAGFRRDGGNGDEVDVAAHRDVGRGHRFARHAGAAARRGRRMARLWPRSRPSSWLATWPRHPSWLRSRPWPWPAQQRRHRCADPPVRANGTFKRPRRRPTHGGREPAHLAPVRRTDKHRRPIRRPARPHRARRPSRHPCSTAPRASSAARPIRRPQHLRWNCAAGHLQQSTRQGGEVQAGEQHPIATRRGEGRHFEQNHLPAQRLHYCAGCNGRTMDTRTTSNR